MVRNIFRNSSSKRSKYGRRYTAEFMIECMMLMIKSPKGYTHLRERKFMPLPDPSRLKELYSSMPCSFGFSELSLEKLEEKLSGLDLQDRFVVVMFDEISLLEKMTLDKQKLLVDGFVDYGLDDVIDSTPPGTPPRIADHALMFMVRSLKYGWIQPIAIFATRGACPAKTLTTLVNKAAAILEQRNARLIALISDGHRTNKSLWAAFGITGEQERVKNWLPHPTVDGAKIFFISDVPHLMKCIRNHIWNKKSFQYGVHVCKFILI